MVLDISRFCEYNVCVQIMYIDEYRLKVHLEQMTFLLFTRWNIILDTTQITFYVHINNLIMTLRSIFLYLVTTKFSKH
jgi:hypothetical protein